MEDPSEDHHPNYLSAGINASHSSAIAPAPASNLLLSSGTDQSNVSNVAPQQLLFPPSPQNHQNHPYLLMQNPLITNPSLHQHDWTPSPSPSLPPSSSSNMIQTPANSFINAAPSLDQSSFLYHHDQQQQQLQLALSCAPAADYEEEEEEGVMVTLENTVADNPVVVFSVSSCCLCHVVKKLFCGMGVSPTVVEIDELDCARAAELDRVLVHIMGERPAVPAVFVGGKLIGGLDRLMACHISGALIPQLKAAGALWL